TGYAAVGDQLHAVLGHRQVIARIVADRDTLEQRLAGADAKDVPEQGRQRGNIAELAGQHVHDLVADRLDNLPGRRDVEAEANFGAPPLVRVDALGALGSLIADPVEARRTDA